MAKDVETMSLSINFPDKILAGLNQSYTITSDEGAPSGKVHIAGQVLPHRVIALGPPKDATESLTPVMKYKVSFLLPKDTVGKTLTLEFQAGSTTIEESKPVTES
jgi:hypothetical protein